ncbi:hypothetical protein BYT27DRAFT_7284279 [Phlegmacium glaucopus]|nr:hypothetical protein BYT27DRAFT_7284279 [Phlegmacium glaucopus]
MNIDTQLFNTSKDEVFIIGSTVRTGSRTGQNRQNRFYRFWFRFRFSSMRNPSVRFSVLQKRLKNRTEPNFGNTTAGIRKSIRLEDPGVLVQIGYSAGSRSSPSFDWVKNLLSKKHSPEEKVAMDVKESSAFALMWNMIRSRLPQEILDDFNKFTTSTNIRRMDANGHMADEKGQTFYSASIGEDQFDFHDAELAPPSGVFGKNYSRAIHYEHQPHHFAVSFTVSRSHDHSAGGHFYMSRYGIRIASAPNTLIAWIPSEPHGTSLQNFSPGDSDPDFFQRGLAFVTSSRLPSIWAKYQKARLSHAEALEVLENPGSSDEKFE